MLGFADFKAAFVSHARDVFGESAVPVVLAITTNSFVYTFSGVIKQASELLVVLGHILAFATAAWAAYATYKAHSSGKASSSDAAKAVGSAAAAASKGSPYVLVLTALTLGVYLIYSFYSSRRVEAAPLAIMAAPAASKRKRKTDDDAGGDDTEALAIPPGAPKWMVAAHELLGVSEKTSRGGSNPIVSAMFEATQLKGSKVDARRVPWCAAFVNAMLERSGIDGTKSAMARSFLKWGVKLEAPRVGCLVVIWRGEYDNGENGHVFFYTREDALYVYGIGGNQGDAVSEARFHKSRVLPGGYRWPRSPAKSKTNAGAVIAGTAAAGIAGVEVAKEVAPPETAAPVAPIVTDTIAQAKEPLQQVASALHGTAVARYIVLGLAVAALIGAGVALYGRWKVRQEHGV